MPAVYNEIEPFAADWMERLEARGLIAPGRVERRSIVELAAADVAGPGQRHFFAGIGGWSYALRLAGVRDDANIWTGSCPCQPFSSAGKRRGTSDARHLWPAWFALIDECRPPVVFGEQVASKDGLAWLDLVFADLERCGYAVGASDLCAAGVGAPHIRQRLYFVAYARGERLRKLGEIDNHRASAHRHHADRRGKGVIVGDALGSRREDPARAGAMAREEASGPARFDGGDRTERAGAPRGLGDACRDGAVEHARELPRDEGEHAQRAAHRDHAPVAPGGARDPWRECDWIPCTDGVFRPVEPGTFPLADGVPARVGRLRGYGNAIVAEQAATFIEAALDAIGDLVGERW